MDSETNKINANLRRLFDEMVKDLLHEDYWSDEMSIEDCDELAIKLITRKIKR